jgi:chromosome segregation ATPase
LRVELIEGCRVELNLAHEQVKTLKDNIAEQDAEEKRLHKQILDNEKLIREQSKDLEQLMNERDILGSQLVRRNDEIALLHEKIEILQTTLQRGRVCCVVEVLILIECCRRVSVRSETRRYQTVEDRDQETETGEDSHVENNLEFD